MLAVLLIVAGVATAVFAHRASEHSAIGSAAQAARAAAQTRVPTVLSYDVNTIDTEFAKVTDNLTGKFRDDFAQLSSSVIIPAAHKDAIVTKATVAGSAVVTAARDRVTLLLFLNQETTSSHYQGPRLDGSRVRVTMAGSGDDWLISEITPV
ncbi:hypothetical protein [Nocardia callitridis]|uniref:Mce-associated membrane protein n=1 Tax=Nocardia callitridis TaxID=648753 RepID=A0ABP9KA17_9NOCA